MLTLCFLVFFKFREIKPPHVFFVKILRGEGVLHVVQHDVGSSLTVQQRRTLRPLALPRRFRAWLVAQHDVGRSFFTVQQRRPLHPLALEPKQTNGVSCLFYGAATTTIQTIGPSSKRRKLPLHRTLGGLMIHWQYPDSLHDRDGPPPLLLTSLQTFFKPRAMLLATRCALLVLTSLKGLQSAQHGPIFEHTRKATSTLIKQFSPAAPTTSSTRP